MEPTKISVTFHRIYVGDLWFDVCDACGALVSDNDVHIAWHSKEKNGTD